MMEVVGLFWNEPVLGVYVLFDGFSTVRVCVGHCVGITSVEQNECRPPLCQITMLRPLISDWTKLPNLTPQISSFAVCNSDSRQTCIQY